MKLMHKARADKRLPSAHEVRRVAQSILWTDPQTLAVLEDLSRDQGIDGIDVID